MKKFLLLIVTGFFLTTLQAQYSEKDVLEVKQLVSKNAAVLGLSADDLNNYVISSTYLSTEGIRMIYLYQSHKGIPVYNQMHVLAFRDGKPVSIAGGRIKGFDKMINNPAGLPSITAGQAVLSAIADAKIPASKVAGSVQNPVTNSLGKLDFGKLGVAVEDITAELFWFPVNEKEFRLVWQIFLAPDGSSDMWSVKVDAATGAVVGKYNYTVYCNWHKDESAATSCDKISHQQTIAEQNKSVGKTGGEKTFAVNSASYRVVKFPAESPSHPGGTPQLHTDPWTMAPGNATTLNWHNDGTADHDSTRGNNVWAAEDRNNTNAVIDRAAVSQTPQPNLTFDYVPDFTQAPTTTTPPNQQFNITNLFYWNNIMHDIVYQYGFNEVSGNFQNSNLGRGGLGNDYVIADAQDGGGSNNANFATPADGTRPRMQMYLWTAPNPDRDGDVDNGIIAHEFGHGISNRLTGGPANSSCVGNAEHGGEGWSDYYGLMVTTDWSTATINDGPNPRGIGTYALNQPPTGAGIRNFRYSTNLAVNPLVYSATLPSQVHNRGEYWCAALWEMTWEMIQQTGINPNVFNAAGVGGNSAALKLVTEGMKLQPCGPGFIDARDAILKADTLFFGAQYSCAIWRAFAKRGMGIGASQGSAGSVIDQIPSFVASSGGVRLNESVQTAAEGQSVTYFNRVTASSCDVITNFFVTDTLPTNVTYVSGGSYNPANRVVTFSPITVSAGQTQTFPVTVTVNAGTYFAPVTHFNETVAGATIPAAWTPSSINATAWSVSTTVSNSAPNSFAALYNVNAANDLSLATTAQYTLSPNTASNYTTLSFWHRFNTEDGWDGGVVEISTNNGATWSDLGPSFITNGYNGSLGTGSNLGGRNAFTGTSTGFIQSIANLSSYAGQSVKIRFRFASDNNTGPATGTPGWWIDDIVLYTEPAVQIRSNLFNAASVRQSFSDTITRIVVGCTPVSITTNPANVNSCAGSNATFTVVAAGTTPAYQWQVNTGSGFVDLTNTAPYSGVTTATLTITGVTTGMNGYLYRCVVSNGCTSPLNSNSASLAVGSSAVIVTQPSNSTVCDGVATSFSVSATGAASYQWQVNTGTGFVNLTNTAPYSGVTTATLNISAGVASMTGYQYRCVLGSCGPAVNSNAATLTISVPVTITSQPASVSVCHGVNHSFSITTTGTVSSYQWQVSTDNGATYTNISGANTSSLALSLVMPGQSGYRYRCIAVGSCGPVTSTAAILTVNALPSFTLTNVPVTLCLSDPAYALTASVAGGTWSGPGVTGSTFTPSAAGLGTKTVSYSVTNAGCTTTQSSIIQVNECAGRHLLLNAFTAVYVYPNPNNGRFNIRLNTDLYNKIGVKAYASDGKMVASQMFAGLAYGSVVPFDLSDQPSGVYHLYIYNNDNGFISKGVSLIIYRP